MRLTIIREDNMVGVDGLFLQIDCSSLPSDLHAVQWYDTTGEEEWTSADNVVIDNLDSYQSIVDAWQAQKDFNDARELDPFYGMEGEELFNAQKAAQEQEIRDTYLTDSTAPVTVGDYTYNGGKESSASVDWAISLAQAKSDTDVTITDIDNVRRVLTFEQAGQVSIAIGDAYTTAFFIKQDALVALAEIEYTP